MREPVALGRKNWLFLGSYRAGKRTANLMSLVASYKDNRVEPWAYLRDVLTRTGITSTPRIRSGL